MLFNAIFSPQLRRALLDEGRLIAPGTVVRRCVGPQCSVESSFEGRPRRLSRQVCSPHKPYDIRLDVFRRLLLRAGMEVGDLGSSSPYICQGKPLILQSWKPLHHDLCLRQKLCIAHSFNMSTLSDDGGDTKDSPTREPSGRVRVSIACQHCRTRKIKCDGEVPCRKCTESGIICQPGAKRKKRAPSRKSVALPTSNLPL